MSIVICKNRKECHMNERCVHSIPHEPKNCSDPKGMCNIKKSYCSILDKKTTCIPVGNL